METITITTTTTTTTTTFTTTTTTTTTYPNALTGFSNNKCILVIPSVS